VSGLPSTANFVTGAGSQWTQTFQLQGVDITGLTWAFGIRPNSLDTAQPPLIKVTGTQSAQGQVIADPVARTVQVVLTPAATALLGRGSRPYALWSNPGTTSATSWCAGVFNSVLIPAP